LVGNVPLFPAQTEHYQKLCDTILAMPSVECLYMLGIPKSSPFWEFLAASRRTRQHRWLYYTPGHEFNRYFYIDLPDCHEAYLKSFKPKTVQTFRRKLRLLEKASGTPLKLERIVDAGQVAGFLSSARQVAEKSWQRWLVGIDLGQPVNRQEVLELLAQQGMLRCYLLKSGDQAFAFVIGFQVNEIFYFESTAYDPKWAQFSPGQCLLYLSIKDCFESNKPKNFYFGPGEAYYKELFANQSGEEVTLMILKRTFANRLKILGHE